MKEFEKWYGDSATSCDPRTANEEGWREALKWVLTQRVSGTEEDSPPIYILRGDPIAGGTLEVIDTTAIIWASSIEEELKDK